MRYSKGGLGHQCLEKIPGQLGPKFTPPLCSDRCGPQGKHRGGAKPQGYKRGHPALRPFRTNFWNSWFLIPMGPTKVRACSGHTLSTVSMWLIWSHVWPPLLWDRKQPFD